MSDSKEDISTPRLENNLTIVTARTAKVRRCYNPLDSLSERTQTVCLIICAGIFIGLICIIIQALNNPICIHKKSPKENSHSNKKISMSGFYQLLETDNYLNYLLALEIPFPAASHIQNLRSENLTVDEDGIRANITTFTPWLTKTISFKFDEPFSVEYGSTESKSKGVLKYFCFKPEPNIINCSSKETKKGWNIVFDLIFSENFLTNKSFFITKNVGMTKKYRRGR